MHKNILLTSKLKDWKILNLGSVLLILYRYPTYYQINYVEDGIPEIRGELIQTNGTLELYLENYRYVTSQTVARFPKVQLKHNDFVMSVRGSLGKIAIIPSHLEGAIITANLIRMQFDKSMVFPQWAKHFLLSTLFQNQLELAGSATTIKTIQAPTISKFHLTLPPILEQHSIAHILDTLDTQIQQTEQLIAKLQHVKLGLFHNLLTRGIDENGNMRDPVAHPEEFKNATLLQKTIKIPKRWKIQSLASLLLGIEAGKSPSCPDQPAGAGEWGVLKVSAVHPAGFRAMENKVITNSAYINPDYEVKNGDLLISRANTYDLVGIVCLVRDAKERLLLSDKTLRLQVDPKSAVSDFLFYILQMSFTRSQIEMHATGSSASMKNISQTSIENLSVYVPPLEEQHKMIDILNAHDIRIDTEEAHLAKLKQIKKGLMADLLTGRVRVTQLLHGE